jgi:hypothetical protein
MRVDERWYNIVDDSLKEQGYGPRDISRFVRDAVIAKATNGRITEYELNKPLRAKARERKRKATK